MGMRDDIQAEIAAAFDDDLSDAVSAFTGKRPGEYDPTTQTVPAPTQAFTGRGVFAGYARYEVDGEHVLSTDEKLIALANEVTAEPQIDDVIDGRAVLNVKRDPAGAALTIQLRKP